MTRVERVRVALEMLEAPLPVEGAERLLLEEIFTVCCIDRELAIHLADYVDATIKARVAHARGPNPRKDG